MLAPHWISGQVLTGLGGCERIRARPFAGDTTCRIAGTCRCFSFALGGGQINYAQVASCTELDRIGTKRQLREHFAGWGGGFDSRQRHRE
jgi:hypothetical protein